MTNSVQFIYKFSFHKVFFCILCTITQQDFTEIWEVWVEADNVQWGNYIHFLCSGTNREFGLYTKWLGKYWEQGKGANFEYLQLPIVSFLWPISCCMTELFTGFIHFVHLLPCKLLRVICSRQLQAFVPLHHQPRPASWHSGQLLRELKTSRACKASFLQI